MINTEYIISDGRVCEVIGKDGKGLPICRVTDLKEIPKDKPLDVPEDDTPLEKPEEKPKRTRKKA